MVTREDIVAEIQRVPDERLDEVYTLLKKYQKNGEHAGDVNVMASLRAIKILAPPDLSSASLYELEKPRQARGSAPGGLVVNLMER